MNSSMETWTSPERASGQKWVTFRPCCFFFQLPDQYFDGKNLYDLRHCSRSKYEEMLNDLRSMRVPRPWHLRIFERLWWGL